MSTYHCIVDYFPFWLKQWHDSSPRNCRAKPKLKTLITVRELNVYVQWSSWPDNNGLSMQHEERVTVSVPIELIYGADADLLPGNGSMRERFPLNTMKYRKGV